MKNSLAGCAVVESGECVKSLFGIAMDDQSIHAPMETRLSVAEFESLDEAVRETWFYGWTPFKIGNEWHVRKNSGIVVTPILFGRSHAPR